MSIFRDIMDQKAVYAIRDSVRDGKLPTADDVSRLRELLKGPEQSEMLDKIEADMTALFKVRVNDGRRMNADQVSAMRMIDPKLAQQWDAGAAERSDAASSADRVARWVARRTAIQELPAPARPEVKDACRMDLLKFGENYCIGGDNEFLRHSPAGRMLNFVSHLQDAILGSGLIHVRWPRGKGKTSWCKTALLWAILYGHRKFMVIVGARQEEADSILGDIWNALELNDQLAGDFPEACVPIRALEGHMQRCNGQLYAPTGKRTQIKKSKNEIALPSIDGFPSSHGRIASRGIDSKMRGLVRGSMRPDFVLIDDLQDPISAKNPETVAFLDREISSTILGLGGHDKEISAAMTSTPICSDDLSELYANSKKAWKTYTDPLMLSMPKCFKSDNDLWEKYFTIRYNSIFLGEPENISANKFYEDHRKEMDEGAEVLDPNSYDHENELSAIQSAMNLLFKIGEESFAAEYQMKPHKSVEIYHLSANIIASRIDAGRAQLTVPKAATFIAAATDLNPSYGLTTCVTAFGADQTAWVIYYGVYATRISDEIPDAQWSAQLYEAITQHGRQISELPAKPDAWTIDASGKAFNVAMRFAEKSEQTCGIKCVPSTGRAGKNWNPYARNRIGEMINETIMCADLSRRKWIAYNSDHWRETQQKAWLGTLGAPGSISLFDGSDHIDFASQVSRETLEYKVDLGGGRIDYHWKSAPGKHDYGDALTMCYMLAGRNGISSTGPSEPIKKHLPVVIGFIPGRGVIRV